MKQIKAVLAKNEDGVEGVVVGEMEFNGSKAIMPCIATDDQSWLFIQQQAAEICAKDGVTPITATFERVGE